MYAARTSNNRVISSGDLYCCLLPRCEALRTCRSGFPIATNPRPRPPGSWDEHGTEHGLNWKRIITKFLETGSIQTVHRIRNSRSDPDLHCVNRNRLRHFVAKNLCFVNFLDFIWNLTSNFNNFRTMVELGLSFSNSGRHLDRKIWQSVSFQPCSRNSRLTFSLSDSAPVQNFWICNTVQIFFKFENLSPVQTSATIDAREIQQCFCHDNTISEIKFSLGFVGLRNTGYVETSAT